MNTHNETMKTHPGTNKVDWQALAISRYGRVQDLLRQRDELQSRVATLRETADRATERADKALASNKELLAALRMTLPICATPTSFSTIQTKKTKTMKPKNKKKRTKPTMNTHKQTEAEAEALGYAEGSEQFRTQGCF